MVKQILLNFGESEQGAVLYDAIRDYASGLDVAQKTLFLMALYEYMMMNKEYAIAEKITAYQQYDGRRK